MNACLTAIGYAVADFLVGSTLLLLAVLLSLSRITQPAYRLAVARATLVALAVLGTICFLPGWPRFSLRNAETVATVSHAQPIVARESPAEQPYAAPVEASPLENHAVEEPASATIERRNDAVAEPSQPTSSTPVVETPPAAVSSPSWRPDVSGVAILAAVELAAAAAVGLWLAYGAVQTMLLCRRAVAAPAFLRGILSELAGPQHRLPRLLLSSSVPNPVALGVFRPTIVLPQSADQDSHESWRSALAHEWAHIRHNDLRFLALSRFLLVLLAIHPLYRFLCRGIREDQEALADAAACAQDRREYAAELLRWARRAVERPAVGAATSLGIWESKSQLSRRVTMLLDEHFHVETTCPRGWRWPWLVAMAVVAVCLPLATLRPLPASADVAEADATAPSTVVGAQPKPTEEASGEAFTGTGEVIDTDTGKPIEGATVTVRVVDMATLSPFLTEAKYQTDARGRYAFTIPAVPSALRQPWVGIEVAHPDYCRETCGGFLAELRRNGKLGDAQPFERVDLAPSELATGSVITPDGKPAAGVIVWYMNFRPHQSTTRRQPDRRGIDKVVTDQQGRFRLKFAKGGYVTVLFLPNDFAPETHLIREGRADLGQFALEKGIVVKGKVLNEQGKPIPKVWINTMARGLFGESSLADLRQILVYVAHHRGAMTDAQGEFSLPPLALGRYRLEVGNRPLDGEAHAREQLPLQFTFLDREVTIEDEKASPRVELRAVPQVVVEGRYVGNLAAYRESPYFGASIHGTLTNDKPFYTGAVVDQHGQFVICAPKGLQQAKLQFGAGRFSRILVREHRELPDSVKVVRHSNHSGATVVTLGTLDRDIKGIEVLCQELPVVQVTARGEDGTPIKYLIVGVMGEAATADAEKRRMAGFLNVSGESPAGIVVEDKDDGRYCISGLRPDKEFTVSIRAHGYEPRLEKLKLPEGAIKKLEVTLKKRPSAKEQGRGASA